MFKLIKLFKAHKQKLNSIEAKDFKTTKYIYLLYLNLIINFTRSFCYKIILKQIINR